MHAPLLLLNDWWIKLIEPINLAIIGSVILIIVLIIVALSSGRTVSFVWRQQKVKR